MSTNQDNRVRGHEQMAAEFLRSVFGGQQTGVIALFTKPGNNSKFVSLSSETWAAQAAKHTMLARRRGDVYYSIGVQAQQPHKGRGKQVDVIALPGLWADVDVRGPNHTATNLPPTIEDAWSILREVPFKPTLVVHSGGGLQAHWLFREPWETATEAERLPAQRLSRRFQAYLRSAGVRKGWTMDETADLCRLLRLPGTYNRKQKTPALVTYEVVEGGQRYNPSDFADFLEMEADPALKAHAQGPAPENPTAEFLRVLGGCPWMRHCKDDAATLSEPEWYRMLAIAGRCKDGVRVAHELSRPYPKYNPSETDAKLRQAMEAAGPTTCSFIESELGQTRYCAQCGHHGKIKSPIVLGLAKPSKRPANNASVELREATDSLRLPQIQTTDRQLRDVTRETLDALNRSNNPPILFAHAGRAVRVAQDENGRWVTVEARDGVLRNLMTKAADYYELRQARVRSCAPPKEVVQDILATPPAQWGFPALQSIITSPALREDGTVIQTPGYDPASRLYYAPDPTLVLPDLAEEPTTDHRQIALEMIQDILVDSPFVDDASRANAIAAMLTPICRPAIRGATPLALFDATTQGTGKTLLSEVVTLIVNGREGALFSAPRTDEEWRKQLTSVLLDGPDIVIIDNVNYRLASAELCKALTETIHGDRILGISQTVRLPVRCTWIATGNNMQVGGDMPRRCYWVRMDAKCPRPFERTGFQYERLKQHVLEHRGELLSALLTLARSWFVAGCPRPTVKPLGGFEGWTMIIGGILQHAGVEGFLANSAQLHNQADSESLQWEGFLKALEGAFYGEPFTVAQIWDCINEKSYSLETRHSALTERAEGLRAALPEFIGEGLDREGFFKQRLGIAFKTRVGRRYGDAQYRIEHPSDDLHGKVAQWKVEAGA